MPEHSVKRIFTFENFTYTITAFDVASEPLTLKFQVDKAVPGKSSADATFTITEKFEDWPYGIQFTETDVLIHHQFNMIEQAIRQHKNFPPQK